MEEARGGGESVWTPLLVATFQKAQSNKSDWQRAHTTSSAMPARPAPKLRPGSADPRPPIPNNAPAEVRRAGAIQRPKSALTLRVRNQQRT